ncbi:hypothetical protein [Marasmitruncus massiliensis]|uniref:hypothetical protein n=1 Tax=Marasmitruncus massiliensis TaxID=1944642 RepID=UPI000C7D085A|nr:hypothetical protein [Marasmitruncus massiliensis]
MSFYKRLNLLMTVQNIANSRLAKSLSVDASLVSRWRTGKRIPSPRNSYVREIAAFFVAQAKLESQKNTLFELMNLEPQERSENPQKITEQLLAWLNEGNIQDESIIEFLDRLNLPRKSEVLLPNAEVRTCQPAGRPVNAEVFYGLGGKQDVIIRFLSAVAASRKPCTLLLYSDESMDWMMKSKEFNHQWQALLLKIIAQGWKIKIIHTIARDLSQLLTAIDQWMPIYMTGAIESFYFPKFREHIVRRTLFIAPGIAAVTSTSFSPSVTNPQLFYYTDPDMIKNLTVEFQEFLKTCYPLMQIFKEESFPKFSELWVRFEEQFGNSILCTTALSALTMPKPMFDRLLAQSYGTAEQTQRISALQKKMQSAFLSKLQANDVTELVGLSLPETFPEATVVPCPRDLLGGPALQYSRSDFCLHLKNIVHLLKTYERYSFLIYPEKPIQNYFFAVKEENGVIAAKNDGSIIFVFRQQTLVSAFQDYLEDMILRIPLKERSKEAVIQKLEGMIAGLEPSPEADVCK